MTTHIVKIHINEDLPGDWAQVTASTTAEHLDQLIIGQAWGQVDTVDEELIPRAVKRLFSNPTARFDLYAHTNPVR